MLILRLWMFGTVCAAAIGGTKFKTRIPVAEELERGTTVAYMSAIFNTNTRAISKSRELRYKILRGTPSKGDSGTESDFSNERNAPDALWVDLNGRTGALTLNRRIDRERDCVEGLLRCRIQFQVVVLPQEVFKIAEVTLEVVDTNDNAPVFPQTSAQLEISEHAEIGEEIRLDEYQASDADEGNNSAIRYSLSSSRIFGLKQFVDRTGIKHLRLVIRQKLNFAEKRTHVLYLTARDMGKPQMSSNISLTINVIDANDHDPIFEKKVYKATLPEDTSVGDVIERVRATDADNGKHGHVTYWISTGSTAEVEGRPADDLVAVNRHTGTVRLRKKLDRALHNGARIVLEARDGAIENQRIGKAVLIIEVLDVNDNVPEITTNFIVYSKDGIAYVSEGDLVNTFLAHVSAVDADNGRNGEIRMSVNSYQLVDDKVRNITTEVASGCFLLTKGGLLATGCILDRESQDRYKVVLEACDKGSPPKCTTKEVTVVVLDENEYTPTFQQTRRLVRLPENSDVGSHVATCIAYDGDSDRDETALSKDKDGNIVPSKNGKIAYRLVAIDSEGNVRQAHDTPFGFDTRTGKISLQKPLDYESSKKWKVSVTANDKSDNAPRHSTCNVTVTLDDVNDNRPVFTAPTKENDTVYASIISNHNVFTRFQAVDYDREIEVEITYMLQSLVKIEQGEEIEMLKGNHFLSLNSTTGELSLAGKSEELLGNYHIVVRACDSGNQSTSRSIGMFLKVTQMTDEQLQKLPKRNNSPLSSALPVALALGVAAVILLLLVFFILCALIRRRRRASRKPESEDETKIKRKNSEPEKTGVNSRSDAITTPKSTSSRYSSDDGKSPNNNKKRTGSCGGNSVGSPERCYVCDLSRSSPSLTEHSPYHTLVENLMTCRKADPVTPSPSDHDSGRGSSDTKSDVIQDKKYPKDNACDRPYCDYPYSGAAIEERVAPSDPNFPRTRLPQLQDQMGPTCSPACREIGHCDTCWMPMDLERETQQRAMSMSMPKPRRHGSECSTETDTTSSGSSYYRMPPRAKTSLSSYPPGSSGQRRRASDHSKKTIEAPRKPNPGTSQEGQLSVQTRKSATTPYPGMNRGDNTRDPHKSTRDNYEDEVFHTADKPFVHFADSKGGYLSMSSGSATGTESTMDASAPKHTSHASVRRTSSLTRAAVV